MKFYSELTGELYTSVDELKNAECKYEEDLAEQEQKENNKHNRLNEIKDIWYSIMIELLFRYPIQCINYKEQIIQYLKGLQQFR